MLEHAAGTELNDTTPLAIIGAGAAGVELAFTARQSGWRGPITVLGDEAAAPYHRPPLSKGLHKGPTSADDIALRPPAAYAEAGIALQTGAVVTAIDRDAKLLRLASGACVPFGRLALCTGGRPRPLPVPGAAEGGNLHMLRTHADAEAIRGCLRPGMRFVVIGGGYVGLEVAAAAALAGAAVSVLEAQDRLLARVASPELSAFYDAAHRAMGVDIRTGATVSAVIRDASGRATGIVLADGRALPADAIVVGVGMLPNVELAVAAGLAVEGGIVVDAWSTTSDPAIFAAGDCTVQTSALYGRPVRLESVPNALNQAPCRRLRALRRPEGERGGALVLVGPVWLQAADGGPARRLRALRPARRRGRGQVHPVLPARQPDAGGRLGEPAGRFPHGEAPGGRADHGRCRRRGGRGGPAQEPCWRGRRDHSTADGATSRRNRPKGGMP